MSSDRGRGTGHPTGSEQSAEARLESWREALRRHEADDVEGRTARLRSRIATLQEAGLDDDEAFLVAVMRVDREDPVAREVAREQASVFWRRFDRSPATPGDTTVDWREVGVVAALAVGAGVSVKVGVAQLDSTAFGHNVALLVAPFLGAYFAWKRRVSWRTAAVLLLLTAVLAVAINVYPFDAGGSTGFLAAVHAPIVLWGLIGVAYAAGRWRSTAGRLQYLRFTGELVVYYALIALGGGLLVGLTIGLLTLADVEFQGVIEDWVLPMGVPGALLVAAWLVEAKQEVVENIAPVLAKIFVPLTTITLLVSVAVLGAVGSLTTVDREFLVTLASVLVVALALLLYAVAARTPGRRPGFFDGVLLAMTVAATAVDGVVLTAMVARTAAFGASPNKVAVLGLGVLMAVHLVWSARLLISMLRRRDGVAGLDRWQAAVLPFYVGWAFLVVVAFGPLFGFV
ncbi:hypothetical protein [Isoptericola sp. 178]|uniref:hypothetical protein n=1 Tax=Isoptericola sp. 178 TaxID=3064651 RepID=UPI00271435F4|nr:hypothetical protein [Isoptericola sp. 178]MDO8145137.1 hypothetical protein [Isoptericola sp. 178]